MGTPIWICRKCFDSLGEVEELMIGGISLPYCELCGGPAEVAAYRASIMRRICERIHAIPVSDRLPEEHSVVLAFCYGEWFSADFHGKHFCTDGQINEPVTHWLPLPPKPE